MDHVWTMNGQCMEYVWTMYGLCIDYVWTMYGLCTDHVWTMYGPCMDYVRTMYGLWRVDESYVDSLSLSIFTRHSRNEIKAILYSNLFIMGGHSTPHTPSTVSYVYAYA
jgi:hypothetical protein